MKAAVLNEYGTPVYGDVAEPEPADGREVAPVLVATLNAIDRAIAAGTHYLSPAELPVVCGLEGVARRADGSRVYFGGLSAPWGSMAELVPLDPARVMPVPDGLDEAVAATLGNAGWAAWLPLSWRASLQPGETVLVLGASGVVGRIAVQAARLLGAGTVVAAARDREALEEVRSLGADEVVVLDADTDAEEAIRAAAGGGVDVVVDYTWGGPAEAALRAGNRGVRLVQVGDLAGPRLTVPAQMMRSKGVSIHGFMPTHADPAVVGRAWYTMAEHVLAGRLRVEVERHALAEVAQVWSRPSRRKLALVP